MNNLLRFLKKCLPILIGIFLLTAFAENLSAQSINKNAAEQEAKVNAREAGFEKIFFTKSVMNSLINGASQVRLYSGLPANSNTKAVLMAIGVDANGNEIGNTFPQSNEDGTPAAIDRATKDTQVQKIDSRNNRTGIISTFNVQDLSNLLNQSNVNGLHFMPGKNGNVLTLTVAAASSSTSTMEMSAFKSPCPPDCGPQ